MWDLDRTTRTDDGFSRSQLAAAAAPEEGSCSYAGESICIAWKTRACVSNPSPAMQRRSMIEVAPSAKVRSGTDENHSRRTTCTFGFACELVKKRLQ